jgi:hypothetical protein
MNTACRTTANKCKKFTAAPHCVKILRNGRPAAVASCPSCDRDAIRFIKKDQYSAMAAKYGRC